MHRAWNWYSGLLCGCSYLEKPVCPLGNEGTVVTEALPNAEGLLHVEAETFCEVEGSV